MIERNKGPEKDENYHIREKLSVMSKNSIHQPNLKRHFTLILIYSLELISILAFK